MDCCGEKKRRWPISLALVLVAGSTLAALDLLQAEPEPVAEVVAQQLPAPVGWWVVVEGSGATGQTGRPGSAWRFAPDGYVMASPPGEDGARRVDRRAASIVATGPDGWKIQGQHPFSLTQEGHALPEACSQE